MKGVLFARLLTALLLAFNALAVVWISYRLFNF